MNKLLVTVIAITTVLCLESYTPKSINDWQGETAVSSEIMTAARSITVYKITRIGQTGVFKTQTVQAEFDQSKMELHVVEFRNGKNHTMSYSGVRNPYKGYDDDPRGHYAYCADCYFFN